MSQGKLGGLLFFLAMVILFLLELLLIMSPPVTSTRRGRGGGAGMIQPWTWWEDPRPGTVVIRYYRRERMNKVVRGVFVLLMLGGSAYVVFRAVKYIVQAIARLF